MIHNRKRPFSFRRERLASADRIPCKVRTALAGGSRLNGLAACCAVVFLMTPHLGAAPAEPTFWKDIRPILRRNCTACHSQKNVKELDVSGGLALDSYDAVRAGAKEPVIRPGASSASVLIQRVTTPDEDRRMPQGAAPLPPETISVLRRWIDSGAREGTRPEKSAVVAAPFA